MFFLHVLALLPFVVRVYIFQIMKTMTSKSCRRSFGIVIGEREGMPRLKPRSGALWGVGWRDGVNGKLAVQE